LKEHGVTACGRRGVTRLSSLNCFGHSSSPINIAFLFFCKNYSIWMWSYSSGWFCCCCRGIPKHRRKRGLHDGKAQYIMRTYEFCLIKYREPGWHIVHSLRNSCSPANPWVSRQSWIRFKVQPLILFVTATYLLKWKTFKHSFENS